MKSLSGRIVTHEKEFIGNVLWNEETGIIEEVSEGGIISVDDVYSPDDCIIFPGFGDIHIHAREDVSGKNNYKEDFESCGNAAIHGGVVHLSDMPNNPVAPIDDSSYNAKEKLTSKSPIHITLYAGIGPGTHPLDRNVPYKAFMGPSVGDLFFPDNQTLEDTIQAYRGQNVSFHCEDPILLEENKNQELHEDRRPPEAEITATDFALHLIEKYELKGKLCHYSTKDGLEKIKAAKMKGVSVTCEVTPTHLFFDRSMLTPENRHWFQMNPPLRSSSDREAMLNGVKEGWVDYLATDHAPHTIQEKQNGISGISQLDTYSDFVSYMILKLGIDPKIIAKICAYNPGEWVRPYLPNEFGKGFGKIEVGYSASFTILNLKSPHTIQRKEIRSKSGWSPFEGFEFPGSLEAVYYRGKQIRS